MESYEKKSLAFPDMDKAMLERLLNNIGDALFIVDEKQNIVYWNKQAELLTGFAHQDVIGRHCLSGIRCDNCMYSCALFEKGEVRNVQVKLRTRDGGILYCRKSAFVLKDNEGKILGGVELLRDETELVDRINRCSAQRNIIESREKIQAAILGSISEGVLTIDDSFKITSFSSRAESITGHQAKQAIGKHCFEVIGSALCKTDCPVRHCQLSSDTHAERITELALPDGRHVPIIEASQPLRNNDGQITGAIIVVEDRSVSAESATPSASPAFAGMVGHSKVMRSIFSVVEQVAPTEATVLVTGESGTGKEMIALALHKLSKRQKGVFEAINCAALPESLLESELFGHVRGAFTGAVGDRVGRIAAASGGTLFLDEVGEMSLALQAKLLRFLQEREYQRVGENKTRSADVRIVAATNKNLELAVREGQFREDLYYRIKVIPVHLPPLRERREDIPLLAVQLLGEISARLGRPGITLSQSTIDKLVSYDWPGNVRELLNAIEYAATLAPGRRIRTGDLPAEVLGDKKRYNRSTVGATDEKSRLLDALQLAGGNKSDAARLLGMHRVTLHRKLKQYGLG